PTRVARFAFEYARKYGRRKVTAVAKDNILKFTDGLFFATARKVAGRYSDIEYQEVLVDNMAMQLVQKPENYDLLLLPNLYGDVLSDLCAGLIGGLGVAPGANLGDEIALFEPVHGIAPPPGPPGGRGPPPRRGVGGRRAVCFFGGGGGGQHCIPNTKWSGRAAGHRGRPRARQSNNRRRRHDRWNHGPAPRRDRLRGRGPPRHHRGPSAGQSPRSRRISPAHRLRRPHHGHQ